MSKVFKLGSKNKKTEQPEVSTSKSPYFFPYQIAWLKDESKIKIWEKSRRIGATYVQSYEDVRDCVSRKVPAVWFSSADISAAKEYIHYCAQWAKLFDAAAKDLGEIVLDDKKGITAFTIQFSNGTRINALSSNPKGFRSKGGKVVLDEFAHHDSQEELWKAAKPTVTWGFPIRIISTHNGKQSLFYKFTEKQKEGKNSWSLHTTPIDKAVDEGLADKITGKELTKEQREQWIKDIENDTADDYTFLEEYKCIPVDESTSFLTYSELSKIERENLLVDELQECKGELYVGVDIGRKKDLTVIWVLEKLGTQLITRQWHEMERAPFRHQREKLFAVLANKAIRRCCIDATGIGLQLSEEAQEHYGRYTVEQVMFTGKSKEEMAYQVKRAVEDSSVLIPNDHKIREDFHSIRKITTAANNIRFDVTESGVTGHADRFWAFALAVHAASGGTGEVIVVSRNLRKESIEHENY